MGVLGRPRPGRGAETQRGASLVEFAVVMPLLLLLVLAIVEFGFLLAQMNEVRHGAREGARYAAVSRPDFNGDGTTGNNADVLAVTCDSVNLPGANATVALSYSDTDGTSGAQRLEYGTIVVTVSTDTLSGVPFVSDFLPATMDNQATFRLEQDAVWSGFGATACP